MSKTAPKVLFFTTLAPYPFWEGSEKFWYDFVRSEVVRQSGLDCRVILPESPATRERGKILESNGVSVDFYTPYSHAFLRRNVNKTLQKLRLEKKNYTYWYDNIKKYSPSLVWFNASGAEKIGELSYAAKLCRDRNIPYWIILQHAPEHFFVEGAAEFRDFSEVVEGAKKIIFVSETNKSCIEIAVGKKLENSIVSRNGLTPEFIEQAAKTALENPAAITGKARFLSLARLSPISKGQHILLEVLSSAAWKERDWEVNFVGAGDRDFLKRLVDYFEIDPKRINFIEKVSEILPVIGKNDVLVMPSLSEAGPFVVIEGMACGRPGIGTPVGDMPRHIREGETGWLAASTQVKHFAEAMERAWTARADWQKIGENARRMVASEYNQTNYIPELLKILISDVRSSDAAANGKL